MRDASAPRMAGCPVALACRTCVDLAEQVKQSATPGGRLPSASTAASTGWARPFAVFEQEAPARRPHRDRLVRDQEQVVGAVLARDRLAQHSWA
jgi:hypothetical protein